MQNFNKKKKKKGKIGAVTQRTKLNKAYKKETQADLPG